VQSNFSTKRLLSRTTPAILLLACAAVSWGQPSPPLQDTVRSPTEEMVEWWNHIGGKLIAMAKDFPEDKYDFKVEKNQRTFAETLLHVASVDYDLASIVSASHIGPDFGKDKHNPSRAIYKTKAEIVKLLENAVETSANVIRQQGDAGLDKTASFSWETGRHIVHVSYIWTAGIEHSGEHLGQLAVYYRANHLTPPESRR
jgi:hypothetical protein